MLSVETGDAASHAQSPSRSQEIERQPAQESVSLSSDTYVNFFLYYNFFFIMKHGSQNMTGIWFYSPCDSLFIHVSHLLIVAIHTSGVIALRVRTAIVIIFCCWPSLLFHPASVIVRTYKHVRTNIAMQCRGQTAAWVHTEYSTCLTGYLTGMCVARPRLQYTTSLQYKSILSPT